MKPLEPLDAQNYNPLHHHQLYAETLAVQGPTNHIRWAELITFLTFLHDLGEPFASPLKPLLHTLNTLRQPDPFIKHHQWQPFYEKICTVSPPADTLQLLIISNLEDISTKYRAHRRLQQHKTIASYDNLAPGMHGHAGPARTRAADGLFFFDYEAYRHNCAYPHPL